MPIISSIAKLVGSWALTSVAYLSFLFVTAVLGLSMYSGNGLHISQLISEQAWEKALQNETALQEHFQRPVKSATHYTRSKANDDATILSGISGKTEIHSDSLPVIRYKGAVVAAKNTVPPHLENASIGDIVSVTNSEGKTLHFKIVRRKQPGKDEACKDLDAPQKDTTLVNCMSVTTKKKKTVRYVLEAIEISSNPEQQRKNVFMQQQS